MSQPFLYVHLFVGHYISGFNKPSKANEEAFLAAVDEVAGVSARLLCALETKAEPKNREEEAAKTKARGAERIQRTGREASSR